MAVALITLLPRVIRQELAREAISYKSSLTSAQIENVAAFIYASEHP